MYVFKGLTWIDIKVVNLITMHVLIMFRSLCLIYLVMFRLTNMGFAVFITYSSWSTVLHWKYDQSITSDARFV